MELKDTVGYKIRLIHNRIHQQMEAKRRDNGNDLTRMQQWTLDFLQEHSREDIYQRDIESAFSISRASASNMLSAMERKGLICRLSVEHDARLKKLVLTDLGSHMVSRAKRDVSEMEEQLCREMAPDEIKQLKQCLDRMLQNLEPENKKM